MITACGSTEVRKVRESFRSSFAVWDTCVESGDRLRAKAERRRMQATSFALLPKAVTALPGWYVFADLEEGETLGGIHYIGITKTERRTIGRRIADRFKDDSCFDASLDAMDEAERRRIIERRLLTVLPISGSNYVKKHLATSALIRKCTHILMVGTRDTSPLIREVERLLIASAVSAGAPLTNERHRVFRGSCSEASRDRATEVIDQLTSLGLSRQVAHEWRSHLRDTADG